MVEKTESMLKNLKVTDKKDEESDSDYVEEEGIIIF
jgi:hypothetical protein